MMDFSAMMGDLNECKRYASRGEVPTVRAIWYALHNGYLHILKWIRAEYPELRCTSEIIDLASMCNQMDCIKWLSDAYPEVKCTRLAIDHAVDISFDPNEDYDEIIKKHLNMLRWIRKSYPEVLPTTAAMDNAAFEGRIEVLECLREHYPNVGCSTNAMDNAASEGRLECLKWIKKYYGDIGCTYNAFWGAYALGFLDCLVWLMDNYGHRFLNYRYENLPKPDVHREHCCYCWVAHREAIQKESVPDTQLDVYNTCETLFLHCENLPLCDIRMNLTI